MQNITRKGLALAGATAMLLASGFFEAAAAATDNTLVKCVGANACRGQSDCKMSAKNGCPGNCKGHNYCKGKGWKKMTANACEKVGGEAYVLEENRKKKE